MKHFYITFRSVTFAQKGEGMLQKNGIRCTLLRTPKWMEQRGCGYCLRIRISEMTEALQILKRAEVPFRKVYRSGADGQLEEWNV